VCAYTKYTGEGKAKFLSSHEARFAGKSRTW
jgi:hypothetical protein